MSNNIKREQPRDSAMDELLVASAIAGSQNNPNPGPQGEVMSELLELIRMDLSDRRKKKQQEEDDLRRLLEARTAGFREEIQRKKMAQTACNHMKERGQGSRIVGQRLSNGHFIFVCQFCQKEFDETTLPPHLQIPLEFVGG